MKPLAYDLFAGLFGWGAGFVAEGWRVIGFDLESRASAPEGCEMRLRDILTIHGSELADASCIVASPPCTEYSFMAMPWKRGKQIAAALRWECEFPKGYKGSRTIAELNQLFDACFRIQREASEAAGHHVPMVLENVKGAQPWVGKAKANYGSYYLWGDVDSIGGRIVRSGDVRFGVDAVKSIQAVKNGGGSWFNVANNTYSGVGQNPVSGVKVPGSGAAWFDKALDERPKQATAIKNRKDRPDYPYSPGDSRKAASAQIAKIPLPLAQHIARCYR